MLLANLAEHFVFLAFGRVERDYSFSRFCFLRYKSTSL